MVTTDTDSLALFTRASQMLAEADTIQKAKELKDLALTAADWAKRKGMGAEAIQYAKSYALEAERKMGEMLRGTERAKGTAGQAKGRDSSGGYVMLPPEATESPPTLAELGLTKRESSEAQALANLPEEAFEQIKTGKTSLTKERRKSVKEEIKKRVDWPTGQYRVIYADPPWKYGNTMPQAPLTIEGNGGTTTQPDDHYPLMDTGQIALLKVNELSLPDSVLFLWSTSPILEDAFMVINAWGFKYKACFVWDKVKHNMGHYNSVRHEFLLIAVKGSCQPDECKLYDSVQTVERNGHSEKPEIFREIINTLYPYGPRIELFARKRIEGWETFGNQCE